MDKNCKIVLKWLFRLCLSVAVSIVHTDIMAQHAPAEEHIYDVEVEETEVYEILEHPEFTQRSINQEQWNKDIKDKIFNYTEPEIKKKSEKDDIITKFLLFLYTFFSDSVGKIVLWAIVLITITATVYYLLKKKGYLLFSKNDKIIYNNIDEIDGSLVPEDWNKAIEDSLAKGNFNLAIRYAYLQLILLLSEKGKINFSPNKTNHHYALELSGSSNYRPFINLTKEYEYAWYGGFKIGRDRCNEYLKAANNLKIAIEQ